MKKTLHIFFEYALFLFLITLSIILTCSNKFQGVILEGVSLWFFNVLPALFPFSVITAIISSLSITSKLSLKLSPLTKRVFRINGTVGYAFIMSVLSGYPIGAKLVCSLKENGLLSKTESVRASVVCSTSSPSFLIACVGAKLFNDLTFGVCLFACHILSVILTGFLFRFYKPNDPCTLPTSLSKKKVDNVFYESVFSSVLSSLTVCGIITVFYLLIEVLLSFGVLSPLIRLFSLPFNESGKAFTLGLFECTKGLRKLSLNGINRLSLPLSCFLCSFGGLSVIMQSIAFLKKAKIKTAPFLVSKILSAVFAFFLGFIFNLILY